ncbi:MAG: Na+/H+ antiporter NhaA [Microbacteriaceae bacterium]|nr:Na+/H+ antiporter NhaA [Microbacteriaceae bacterium]
MRIQLSEKLSALLLLGAAAIGLITANSPIAEPIRGFLHLQVPTDYLGFSLDIADWVKDGLLAVFFLLAAIELRHELSNGELASVRRALVPTIAAVGGVAAPAAIFLLIVRSPDLSVGWPIPTATDIAFALGLLAMVGRGLPRRIRALLLALAVIDDLIAILIIGIFFTDDLKLIPLLVAVPVVLAFGWLSLQPSRWRVALMIALALTAWWLVAISGVHPTIAGVALGLVLAPRAARKTRAALDPISRLIVLPLFAFVAASVAIPKIGLNELSPVFWGILLALPLGKIVGIGLTGWITSRLAVKKSDQTKVLDLLVVASLGGVGFTVSLLMNELAFEGNRLVAAEGTLAVLCATAISGVIGLIFTAIRARHYRRLSPVPHPQL